MRNNGDGLQSDDMPTADEELTIIDLCAWCGDTLPNLDWHPYCSSQCELYAEMDDSHEVFNPTITR